MACDMEGLILSVQKYPCLWDISHEEYHNHVLKDLAWKEICKDMCDEWDNATDVQKKRISADYKKKWTNVRDYYRKDLIKKKELGSAAKKMKKYVYADLLTFLQPMLLKRKSDFETRFETITCESNPIDDEDSQEVEYENEEYLEEKYAPTEMPTKKSVTDTVSLIQTPSKAKPRREASVDCDDDDTLFLLSFRGDMKQMDSEQKLDFKIGLLNLVRSIMHSDNAS